MTRPGYFALALAGLLLALTPGASAAPFVFPDRPDIIFAFPDTPPGLWFSFPDPIGFPGASPGYSGSSIGGGTGGSGSGGGAQSVSRSNDNDPPDLENVAFDTLSAPFNVPGRTFSNSSGPAPGYGGIPFFLVVFPVSPTDPVNPTHDVVINEPESPDTLLPSPAPEPGTLLLVGTGIAGLLTRRYRRLAARRRLTPEA
jgi:hypothetical protein